MGFADRRGVMASIVALVGTAAAAAAQEALPPALLAALQSGNAANIRQAIMTLSGGNPAQAASLAGALAAAAERLLGSNPRGAIASMEAALAVMSTPAVRNAAPAAALSVAASAMRVAAAPGALQANAGGSGGLALAATRLVTDPGVYRAGPDAALRVMADAYGVVNLAAVRAAVPGIQADTRTVLVAARDLGTLRDVNPQNPTRIAQILGSTATLELPQQQENAQQLLRDSRGENPFTAGSPT